MSADPPRAGDGALVLFSGGQDSTTCLAWALERYERVETIGFDYGQRHRIELDCRDPVRRQVAALSPAWAERLGDDHLLSLPVLGTISDTALTRETEIAMTDNGLPNTFVPGRNLLFLTLAAALAYRRGLATLVGGMCETDYSGYPDCRDRTMRAMRDALSLGMDRVYAIETPLMWLDKAQTWQLAFELGGQPLVDVIREATHTCYVGERGDAHPWGHGCGRCPACELRARGFERWQQDRAAAAR
ncbi:MAG: 7-cyano-7-deazaguanine synthase QueC [Burkholderiaceae bacterium]